MTRTPDSLALEARVSNGPSTYRFHTADGVCSKRSFRTAELQLLEHCWDDDRGLGRLLCPEANYGVVGTVLAPVADAVRLTDSSARAVRLCEKNSRENDVDASVTLRADLTTLQGRFDTVAYAPKPYTPLPVGRQRIADALSMLRPGGRCYVAAAKRTGLSRYENCLRECCRSVECVRKSGSSRVLEAIRPETFEPPSYVSPERIRATVDGVDLTLVAVPGLFSTGRLDDGTRLLLESATLEDGDRVLDLCCGYGAVGTYAARVADCEVWLTDDDRVATRCAECSLRASGVDGTVVTADCLAGVADRSFDRILCNPPTHAGDGVLADLFADIDDHLAPNGRLSVVHHRDLDLDAYLDHVGPVERRRTGVDHVVRTVHP